MNTMDMFIKLRGLVVMFAIVGFQAQNTVGLLCYQCVDAENDMDCRDAGELLKDTRGKNDKDKLNYNEYVKDCASEKTNNTMCMVETFKGGQFDRVKSYMRDCSDGRTFSFDVDNYPRFSVLVADNQSTCVYDSVGFGTYICIQLCEGDMCNGPRQDFITVNSTASTIVPTVTLPFLNALSAGQYGRELLFFISVVFTRIFL